jgi:hypothetical protein
VFLKGSKFLVNDMNPWDKKVSYSVTCLVCVEREVSQWTDPSPKEFCQMLNINILNFFSQYTSRSSSYTLPNSPPPISIYLWLYSHFVGPWPLFTFLIFYTDGRTPWTGDRSVARPLPAHRTAQTQNKRTQTSMLRVGFEPTIPVFERRQFMP